jgi:hypothetical protein
VHGLDGEVGESAREPTPAELCECEPSLLCDGIGVGGVDVGECWESGLREPFL